MIKSAPDFSLILPCYNEGQTFKDNVNVILKSLNALRYKYEIILVEDKSVDKTKSTVYSLVKQYPKTIKAIYHDKNIGRGASVADGIKQSSADIVGFIDVDCEVSPVYISDFVNLIKSKKTDIVVGKRFYKVNISSLIRSIVSSTYRHLSNLILPTRAIDTESGYKFFKRNKILPLLKLADNHKWFWDTQIVVLGILKGLKVTEIPVLFIRREDKKSTVKLIPDTIDYLKSLYDFRLSLLNRGLI